MIHQLIGIALGTLISEDLACIATGVLIAQGRVSWIAGIGASLGGIFAGDVLLYLLGRFAGAHALRFISAERVEKAKSWLESRGLAVVFISRFTPGLRTATYFAAGLVRVRFVPFAGYLWLAAAIWTPLLIASSVFLGRAWLTGAAMLAAALFLRGRIPWKKLRWEFWPSWLAYLPLTPYLLCLAIRHRSLTVFTAANPGIPSGGLMGESKSEILRQLSNAAEFRVIRQRVDVSEFPVVLKPDVGERGSGVAVIRSQSELDAYMRAPEGDVILQRYIPGAEFGVFYYRYPNESRGRIFSITEKHFPTVTGDARRNLRELIAANNRAACMIAAYERASKRPMSDVPAAGERVQLIEIGSHCRGAVFLDGRRWNSPELEAAIDKVSRSHPGFYFGRFDVRAPSPEALQRGEFTVLELNGVGAEATHIYDPAVSLVEAYQTMRHQWRVAFEIGAMNRDAGASPTSLRDLLRLTTRCDTPLAKLGELIYTPR